jgi:hypothetical protein
MPTADKVTAPLAKEEFTAVCALIDRARAPWDDSDLPDELQLHLENMGSQINEIVGQLTTLSAQAVSALETKAAWAFEQYHTLNAARLMVELASSLCERADEALMAADAALKGLVLAREAESASKTEPPATP